MCKESERRKDGESGKRKVLLTDHQRRITTEFERKAKDMGATGEAAQHGPISEEEQGRVKKAFDKARADLWGMLTAMKKGLIDAQDKIFHLEKENKRLSERVRQLEPKDDI